MNPSARSLEEEGTFESAGGVKIAYRAWRATGPARGLVVIVPGFNSHSGYYGWVAEQLVELGLSVYAVDLRGRGRSDGERFYVPQFADYLADVAGMVKLATPREPDFRCSCWVTAPEACWRASTPWTIRPGSRASSARASRFRRPAPDVALAVLKGLGHVFPHAHVLRLKNEDFSRDPHAVAVMNADPLIAHETQPTQTVAELVRADERLKTAFPQITLPMLILHGTADKAAKAERQPALLQSGGLADKTLKLYDGHVHDLLNDVGKEAGHGRHHGLDRRTHRPVKAIRVTQFGGPDALAWQEIEQPVPGAGQVLVRVEAAGVGPWDAWVRSGTSAVAHTLPLIPGADLSGVVERAGPGAPFHAGDAVYGVTNAQFTGAYAEDAVADATMIAHSRLALVSWRRRLCRSWPSRPGKCCPITAA